VSRRRIPDAVAANPCSGEPIQDVGNAGACPGESDASPGEFDRDPAGRILLPVSAVLPAARKFRSLSVATEPLAASAGSPVNAIASLHHGLDSRQYHGVPETRHTDESVAFRPYLECDSGSIIGTDTCNADLFQRVYAGDNVNIQSRKVHRQDQDCWPSTNPIYSGNGIKECYWTMDKFLGWNVGYAGTGESEYSPKLGRMGF
jgi:hypothetical protein